MNHAEPHPHTLDITRETCPMTFVRTRIALDGLQPGEVLCVTLRGSEPLKNVTRSTEALGHTILSTEDTADDAHILTIRRN